MTNLARKPSAQGIITKRPIFPIVRRPSPCQFTKLCNPSQASPPSPQLLTASRRLHQNKSEDKGIRQRTHSEPSTEPRSVAAQSTSDSDFHCTFSSKSHTARRVSPYNMDSSAATEATEAELSFQRAEFLAEDELIEINPMVKSDVIILVRGEFGPFEPSVTTSVPLWLALALKKFHRCKILPPRWLTVREVENFISEERENEDELQPIPFYFSEIASLLFHHASDDLTNAAQLRRSVEDLSNIRDSKMRKWMQEHVRDRVNAIKVNNLSLHEISVHRPILSRVLDNLYTIHVAPDTKGLVSDTNPTTNTASESDARPVQGRQLRRVIRKT